MQLPNMHYPAVNCFQFLTPPNTSLPIQSHSNIQSEPLTVQFPTMHSTTVNGFPIPLTHQYLPSHSIPSNIQSVALTMQLPTMHSPAVNRFPIPLTHQYLPSHSIPQQHSVSTTHHAAFHCTISCSQLFPNSSHPPITPFPFNPPVSSSQHHSPCMSPLCSLLHSIVSQFLPRTNISLPIQSPSNIQSAPLAMQLPTMHSPAVNCFPIPLTHHYLPSHSIPSNIQSAPLTMQLPTMHSPAVNRFPIPLSPQYLPSHSILQ